MTNPPRPRKRASSNLPLIITGAVALVAIAVAATLAVVLITERQAPAAQPVAAAEVTAKAVAKTADPATPTAPPAQPRTRAAARAAAEAAFDAYAAGEYGEFWDTWSAADKQLVSRADYVRRWKLCPSISQGLRFDIQQVKVAGNRANVRAARSIAVFTYRFLYEDGAWRYQLLPDQRQPYETKSVKQIAAEERAAGRCG